MQFGFFCFCFFHKYNRRNYKQKNFYSCVLIIIMISRDKRVAVLRKLFYNNGVSK